MKGASSGVQLQSRRRNDSPRCTTFDRRAGRAAPSLRVQHRGNRVPRAQACRAADQRVEIGRDGPLPERANAVVKWTAGDKIGAEFAAPISVEAVKSFSANG